jgi:hypothetical protein
MKKRITIVLCAVGVGFLGFLVLIKFAIYDCVGMRLLRMEIYHNDQLVLRTIFDAPDREGAPDFWRRAGAEPFASEEEVARVKSDEDNPLRASLAGPVRIRILHVDRLMSVASLTNLVLLRNTRDSLKWYLAPEEVQRTKRAAGL